VARLPGEMGRPEEEEDWEREMRHGESERTGGG
jgi:hypothetical protein